MLDYPGSFLCTLAPSNQIKCVGPRVGDLHGDWSRDYPLLILKVSLFLATALDLLSVGDLGEGGVQCDNFGGGGCHKLFNCGAFFGEVLAETWVWGRGVSLDFVGRFLCDLQFRVSSCWFW